MSSGGSGGGGGSGGNGGGKTSVAEGDAVWCVSGYAGCESFPPWPAKLHELKGSQAEVHFFGDYSLETLDVSHLRAFLPYFAGLRLQESRCKEKDRRKWEKAIGQALQLAVSKSPAGQQALLGITDRGFAKRMQKVEQALPPILNYTPVEDAKPDPQGAASQPQKNARTKTSQRSQRKGAKARRPQGPGMAGLSQQVLCLIASYTTPVKVYNLCMTCSLFHDKSEQGNKENVAATDLLRASLLSSLSRNLRVQAQSTSRYQTEPHSACAKGQGLTIPILENLHRAINTADQLHPGFVVSGSTMVQTVLGTTEGWCDGGSDIDLFR